MRSKEKFFNFLKLPFFFSFFLAFLLGWEFLTLAKESQFKEEEFCPFFVENLEKECQKLGIGRCREVLEQCGKFYQKEGEKYQKEIVQIQQKKRSLENEIWILRKKIKNLNYKIYQNNLVIKDLNFQIQDTQNSIEKTEKEIVRIRQKLALLLQLRYEQDQRSLLEIFLGEETLSGFFDNLIALESLNQKTQELLTNIKRLKESLESHRDSMIQEKEKLESVQILVSLQKEENERLKQQKKSLLKKTQGQEILYQRYLKESTKRAQEIRKKIFELAQIPQGRALTLERAYQLAREVERLTGTRAAFLLGVLKVESDIGKNVGQCNCQGVPYCRHPEIHWKEVMNPRQWPYFEKITKELGLNPKTTPVSCAIERGKVQWGGAMGPAQFMPETWWRLGYKKRVEEILGEKPANPWRVRDAFLAAGLYLADWGAASQKEIAEIGAARAYLCGTTRLTPTCRIAGGRNYVYQVMRYANQFQQYIDEGILKER